MKLLPKTVNAKFGSFGEKRPVASVPPCNPIVGSTPSAMAMEDDSPRKIKAKNQREIFTASPHTKKHQYSNLNFVAI